MSRFVLGLCSFVLTVGLITFVEGDAGASAATGKYRHAIGDPSSCSRPTGPRQIILVAKKKPKAKKGAKKEDAPEPAEKPATPAPAPAADSKDDSGIKFSRDIAPIFVANCNGCHSETGKAAKKSKLDLTTFDRIKKGSISGDVLSAGKPEESELLLRVKGESQGPKMPPGNNKNLGEGAIGRIEEWIKAGAMLDKGIDPKAKLETYATSPEQLRRDELAKMKPAERDKLVEDAGLERWKKANPKVTPEVTIGKNFIMFSALPKGRAEATLKLMDAQVAKLKVLLGPTGVMDWAEKPSLIVLNERNGFVEFVRGIEKHEPEEEDRGTASFGTNEPYVAVLDPLLGQEDPGATKKSARGKRDEEGPSASRTLGGILTEQLTIGLLAKAGKPPRWVSLGLGASLEAQLEGVTPYIERLRKDAYQLAEQGWTSKGNEAMGDEAKADESRAVGYAIMDWMGKTAGPYLGPFVREMLKGGGKLDDAIGNVLQGTRDQFLQASGEYVMGQYGGRRR